MGIPVKLEVFEGPLDLLLHLIDKHKLNIYDIPIVTITEQYMKYIDLMEANKLEVMSEFIEMAATLISIKAKMLLPVEEEEEEEEEDPRQALINKLVEYKKFKLISEQLREQQDIASKVVYRQASIPEEVRNFKKEVDPIRLLEDVDFNRLYTIFQSVIKKKADKIDPIRSKFGDIKKEVHTIEDKMTYLKNMCKNYTSFSFRDVLEGTRNRVEVIVTFLAVLELMKTGEITIAQESAFDDISIQYIGRRQDEVG